MRSLLSLVCPSVIPCHTHRHRSFPVPLGATEQNRFFSFRMVFTEDLGNCSLAVRTTSASNAGPADGFVRRTFNETPGDGIPVPSCSCRLSPLLSPSSVPLVYFSSFLSPPAFVDIRLWTPQLMRFALMLARPAHTRDCEPANGHVRHRDRGFTRDFARRFVSRPSHGIGVFRPVVAFFPSPRRSSCPFSGVPCAMFDNGHAGIARGRGESETTRNPSDLADQRANHRRSSV